MVLTASAELKSFCTLFQKERCDVCGSIGSPVSEDVIKNVVTIDIDIYSGFFSCNNPKCSVSYFNKQEKIFILKNDLISSE